MAVGSTTREVFEAYVERVLSTTLKPGQVVVMDNLSARKGERVRELIEGRGCELLLLRGGCSWRMLPREHPPRQTVYYHSRMWRRLDGRLRRAHDRLREEVREARRDATGTPAPP